MNIKIVSLETVGGYSEEDTPSAMFGPAQRTRHADIFYSLNLLEDLSFKVIREDGEPLAICLMTACETVDKNTQISNFGHPAVFWFTERADQTSQPMIETLVKNELKKRLSAYPTARLSTIDCFSRGCLSPLSLAMLQMEGAISSLSFTHVLDLRNSIDNIYAALRGSYKNLIRKAKKRFELIIVNASNYSDGEIARVRECHALASGRDAHPDRFWVAMEELVKKGNAFLVFATEDGATKGASIFTQCADIVYYSLGAYDRELSHTGLSHACVWTAIEYACIEKRTFFECGRTDFATFAPWVSEKEMSIGFFKRGFGGANKPVLYISSQNKL